MARLYVDWSRIMTPGEVMKNLSLMMLPCPFCGRGAGLYMGPLPHVTCTSCGADGPRMQQRDQQYAAVVAWNQRSK